MRGSSPTRLPSPRAGRLYVLAAALLAFGLEPLVGRLLLPQFGGGFQVWTTSLMFFQGALFLAYAYAHLLAPRLGVAHLGLVALALVQLPPGIDGGGEGLGPLLMALAGVLLPFVALTSASVVTQRWTLAAPGGPGSAYGLYAWSNAGSLGALLLYVLVVERFVPLGAQRLGWSVLYVAHLAVAVWAARELRPGREPPGRVVRPRLGVLGAWVLLAAAPSALSMAVTNLLALEAGNLPLVWVPPLAVYLGSFVVAFAEPEEGERSRVPRALRRLWPHVAFVGLFVYLGADGGGALPLVLQLLVLAVVALAAHGELYVRRPRGEGLTAFYLAIALGGWLGGAVVALLAPVAFPGLWEYPLALALLAGTMLVLRRDEAMRFVRRGPVPARVLSGLLLVLGAVLLAGDAARGPEGLEVLAARRSFYGLYRVDRWVGADGVAVRELVSGSTRHGRQREGDPAPLSYYHREGPLGDVMALHASGSVAVVGLGVGAGAAYASAARPHRFYEIDPAVEALARGFFAYLEDAGEAAEVVLGDARRRLQQEEDEGAPEHALLVVDAFTGDGIPIHLLTREALALYRARTGGGPVLYHVSNRFYALAPVLRRLADAEGLAGVRRDARSGLAELQDPSRYVLLAAPGHPWLAALAERGWSPLADVAPARAPWTDAHVDPLGVLAPFL